MCTHSRAAKPYLRGVPLPVHGQYRIMHPTLATLVHRPSGVEGHTLTSLFFRRACPVLVSIHPCSVVGDVASVAKVQMAPTRPLPRWSHRLPMSSLAILLLVSIQVRAQSPVVELFCDNYGLVCRQQTLAATPEECQAVLASIADGSPGASSGNTIACR